MKKYLFIIFIAVFSTTIHAEIPVKETFIFQCPNMIQTYY